MLAVITRPMVIATDAGTAKQFVPLKDGIGCDIPQLMSEGEFNRLRRADAAARFIEVNHDEVETEETVAESPIPVETPSEDKPVSKAKAGRKPKG